MDKKILFAFRAFSLFVFVGIFVYIFVAYLQETDNSNTAPSGAFHDLKTNTLTMGAVCCTFDVNNVTKTCAAPEGRGCTICAAVCNEHKE